MTARLPVSTEAAPLSRVTVGALNDLGYDVDYSSAQTLSLDGISCPCSRRLLSRDLMRQTEWDHQKEHQTAYETGLSLLPGPNSPRTALAVFYRDKDGKMQSVVVKSQHI